MNTKNRWLYEYNNRKGIDYKKYSSINRYNKTNPNSFNNFRNNNSLYSYNRRKRRNNENLNHNNIDYNDKIQPEEKSKYIAHYYRRNEKNYNKTENK